MRFCCGLVLLVATGCGSESGQHAPRTAPSVVVTAPAESSRTSDTPPAPSPSHDDDADKDVEDVALRFYRAIFTGDTATARQLALTYEEASGMTKKEVSTNEFEAALAKFLNVSQESTDSVEVVRVEVVERGTLSAAENEKITRDLQFALVRPILRRKGEERPWMGLPFFKTEHGWRFSPKT